MSDMILDACMKFQNYPIKTVGDVFYSNYIRPIITFFQNFKKNAKNSKIA